MLVLGLGTPEGRDREPGAERLGWTKKWHTRVKPPAPNERSLRHNVPLGVGFEESHVLAFGTNGNSGNNAFNPMGGGADNDDDGYDNDDGGGYDGGFDDNSFDTVRDHASIPRYPPVPPPRPSPRTSHDPRP